MSSPLPSMPIGTFLALAVLASACAADEAAGPSGEPASATEVVEPAPAGAASITTPSPPAAAPTAPDAATPAATPTVATTLPACDALEPAAITTAGPASGNPVVADIDLRAPTTNVVELPAPAAWVVGSPVVSGVWLVQLIDGTVVRVVDDEVVATADAPDGPIEILASGEAVSAYRHHGTLLAANENLILLPDTRVVTGRTAASEPRHVALIAPTERYGHGVLGDRIEAAGVAVFDDCGDLIHTIDIDAPDVIEEVAPLLADVDGDGGDDIIITLSNSDGGARLAAFSLDGRRLGETSSIGRGNRWRNQLGVAPTGPDGQVEVIDVRTPHIGGRVQFFQLIDGGLERTAASGDDYTTHTIGSRNLDMGLVADVDDDGALDAVLFTSDRRTLVALSRRDDRTERRIELSLPSPAVSNLARHPLDAAVAVATADGQLWIAAS